MNFYPSKTITVNQYLYYYRVSENRSQLPSGKMEDKIEQDVDYGAAAFETDRIAAFRSLRRAKHKSAKPAHSIYRVNRNAKMEGIFDRLYSWVSRLRFLGDTVAWIYPLVYAGRRRRQPALALYFKRQEIFHEALEKMPLRHGDHHGGRVCDRSFGKPCFSSEGLGLFQKTGKFSGTDLYAVLLFMVFALYSGVFSM